MFGLKIFVQVQTFRRVPPGLPHNFCHPAPWYIRYTQTDYLPDFRSLVGVGGWGTWLNDTSKTGGVQLVWWADVQLQGSHFKAIEESECSDKYDYHDFVSSNWIYQRRGCTWEASAAIFAVFVHCASVHGGIWWSISPLQWNLWTSHKS